MNWDLFWYLIAWVAAVWFFLLSFGAVFGFVWWWRKLDRQIDENRKRVRSFGFSFELPPNKTIGSDEE